MFTNKVFFSCSSALWVCDTHVAVKTRGSTDCVLPLGTRVGNPLQVPTQCNSKDGKGIKELQVQLKLLYNTTKYNTTCINMYPQSEKYRASVLSPGVTSLGDNREVSYFHSACWVHHPRPNMCMLKGLVTSLFPTLLEH